MEELIDYGYDQVDTVFYPPIQQGHRTLYLL